MSFGTLFPVRRVAALLTLRARIGGLLFVRRMSPLGFAPSRLLMFASALSTLFAKAFHPNITVLGYLISFATPTAFSGFTILFWSSICRVRTALSSITVMATLALPVKQVVHASDKPFVSAMLWGSPTERVLEIHKNRPLASGVEQIASCVSKKARSQIKKLKQYL